MDLIGWKYKGRKITKQLHTQFLAISKMLKDANVACNKTWPQMQPIIADRLGIKPGQVRTIKLLMEEFGIITQNSLNGSKIIDPNLIFNEEGAVLLNLIEVESMYDKLEELGKHYYSEIELTRNAIKAYYRKVFTKYYLINSDNVAFHPLKITLKALDRYKSLDYWEWYILNTLIQNDDSEVDEEQFDKAIKKYRNHLLVFRESDIISNQLSHSYILGSFVEAGYINLEGSGKSFKATINSQYISSVNYILGR